MFWEDVPYEEESEGSEFNRASASDDGEQEDSYFLCGSCFFGRFGSLACIGLTRCIPGP